MRIPCLRLHIVSLMPQDSGLAASSGGIVKSFIGERAVLSLQIAKLWQTEPMSKSGLQNGQNFSRETTSTLIMSGISTRPAL
ncbi:Uncharacterized protein HZ326_31543 [Fusarium oxysporum f. sp. albedinis]|nr:Uncharacterized protein HZ326_31543 [Fusarium oxysporum f. sp. albedinis]